MDLHSKMMNLAISEARKAFAEGEVPVGAVVYTNSGKVIASAHNLTESKRNPTAHAEFLALQTALKKLDSMYLENCTVAITLEPCAMCAQALSWARVKEIRFGAYDVKSGGTENGARVLAYAHHKPTVIGGQQEETCKELLQKFFKDKR